MIRSLFTLGPTSLKRPPTDAHELTEKISYQASHDVLTGLINRREFENRLKQLILRSEDGEKHVVLYLDLDEFKIINDTCGHHAGDELLRQLPTTLREATRKSDLIARLGGDEFGIILTSCDLEQAMKIANLILKTISVFQFYWENRSYKIGASIGLVMLDDDSTDFIEARISVASATH